MASNSATRPANAFAPMSTSRVTTVDKPAKQRAPLADDPSMCRLGVKATEFNSDTLQASSTGEVILPPSVCKFTIIVSSTKERVQDAKNSVTRRLNYVLQTLHNKHVKESERQVTETLSRNMNDRTELFSLEAVVAVSLHDISLYQPINNTVVEKLDRHVVVSAPEFMHNPVALEHARRQASLLAARNCRQKATELAQTVGTRLGTVLSIHEDFCHEMADGTVAEAAVAASDLVPAASGAANGHRLAQEATLRIAAGVTVTFELRSQRHKEQKF